MSKTTIDFKKFLFEFNDEYVGVRNRHEHNLSVQFGVGTPAHRKLVLLNEEISAGDKDSLLLLENMGTLLMSIPILVNNIRFFEQYAVIMADLISHPEMFLEFGDTDADRGVINYYLTNIEDMILKLKDGVLEYHEDYLEFKDDNDVIIRFGKASPPYGVLTFLKDSGDTEAIDRIAVALTVVPMIVSNPVFTRDFSLLAIDFLKNPDKYTLPAADEEIEEDSEIIDGVKGQYDAQQTIKGEV